MTAQCLIYTHIIPEAENTNKHQIPACHKPNVPNSCKLQKLQDWSLICSTLHYLWLFYSLGFILSILSFFFFTFCYVSFSIGIFGKVTRDNNLIKARSISYNNQNLRQNKHLLASKTNIYLTELHDTIKESTHRVHNLTSTHSCFSQILDEMIGPQQINHLVYLKSYSNQDHHDN